VATVFFGGGTPSLFPPAAVGRFLDALAARASVAGDAEVTLEANPGATERGSLAGFRSAGINRVSLGVQSFHDERLAAIGRIHDGREALGAVAALQAAGFENFNLDLMYGLPGQTVDEALDDVAQALATGAPHVSHYQLTLEPGTPFARHPPPLPNEDVAWAMQTGAAALFAAHGLARYEVSAWSRPGRECRHNLNYWCFGDYLGLGAGAHGKLSLPGGIRRREKQRRPTVYLSGARTGPERWLDEDERRFEFMLNALRLTAGFDAALFESRTGLAWHDLQARLRAAQLRGLLETQGPSGWRPTPRGLDFLNDLQGLFLPQATPA
jgi:oxygen-independent coproporphyrinogen-3 oxidase